jgi:hypothetical protein
MSLPRHPSRHVHATAYNLVKTYLTSNGWVNSPVNFNATPVTIIDYQPDERGVQIAPNTVAISMGDVADDVLEELGGGSYTRSYPIFADIYGELQSISEALGDDILQAFPLVDQATWADVSGAYLDVDRLLGPERPAGSASLDQITRYWRIMRIQLTLFYTP